ncbi:MAG TPA: tetratricopeptide repeat protein [Edaphobacter sp.]|nr:tetratricopeptide repeat protein [Edaphobacter sp.]
MHRAGSSRYRRHTALPRLIAAITAPANIIDSMALKRDAKARPAPPHWTEALPGWAWALIIAAWTLLLYARTLKSPFVYDDLAQVVRNPNLAAWHDVFTRFLRAPVTFSSEFRAASATGSFYRPLYWLSLAVDRHLWGLHASGFHLTSIFLHALNGILLFHLLRRLRLANITAAATTLLWLSLPINSEAVAWISARAYPLCLFFLLVSLISSLRYLDKHRPLGLLAAFLCACAALLSHESGILILPFATLVILLRSQNSVTALKQKQVLILLGADLAAIVVAFDLRFAIGAHNAPGSPAFWTFAPALWKYIGWALLPVHMSVERSTSTPPNAPSPLAFVAIVAFLAILAAIALLWRRTPATASGLAWLVVALIPFCGLVFLYQGMAERFLYIASIGAALAIVTAATHTRPSARTAAFALIAIWAVWNIVRLESRLADWNSPITLYRSSLEATPSSAPLYFNLGFNLREAGRLPEAADAYQQAIRINPQYQRAYSSLGETYARMGDLPKATAAYQQALAVNPSDAATTLNLAVVLHQSGNNQQAESTFRRAIALDPQNSAAYTDLGVLLYRQRKVEDAETMFLEAINHNSTDPNPYSNLALLYEQSGHPALALSIYQKLLTIRPNDPEVLANIQRLKRPH